MIYKVQITLKFNSFDDALAAQKRAALTAYDGMIVHESHIEEWLTDDRKTNGE